MPGAKRWDIKEENLLKRHYSNSSTKAVAELLGRSISSVHSKATDLRVFKPVAKGIKKGSYNALINLIYKGETVRVAKLNDPTDIRNAIGNWVNDIRPALRRGEKVTFEIEHA